MRKRYKSIPILFLWLLLPWCGSKAQTLLQTDGLAQQLQALDSARQVIVIHNMKGFIPEGGHIQGIQQTQINGKQSLIITGSSSTYSYYAIAYPKAKGYRLQYLKHVLPVPYKHAGGFQLCGNILAVGAEDNTLRNKSKIVLFDITNPGNTDNHPLGEIDRRGNYEVATSGATALVKHEGKYWAAVADWGPDHIDFYQADTLPDSTQLFHFTPKGTWDIGEASKQGFNRNNWGSYQNMQLFEDTNHQLLLFGTCRKGSQDLLDVFSVSIADGHIELKHLARQAFHTSRRVSFRYGGGVCMANGRLTVLATQRKPGRRIRINVFGVKNP